MLAEIHEYQSQQSEISADKYIDDLLESTEKLKKHPEFCAPCRNPKLQSKGFRCCLFKSHIIIYQIVDNEVIILAVIHSRRNPDNVLEILEKRLKIHPCLPNIHSKAST